MSYQLYRSPELRFHYVFLKFKVVYNLCTIWHFHSD